MTARMVRINDSYIAKFDEMVATFKDNKKIVDDQNLKHDPYFYERKASLDKTIKAIDDVSITMLSHEDVGLIWKNEYEDNLCSSFKTISSLYKTVHR